MKKAKKYIIRIIAIVVSLAVLLAGFVFLGEISVSLNDDTYATVYSFSNIEDDSLDYVLIGASAPQTGIYPDLISEEYGINGYDLCFGGNDSRYYVSMLKYVLEHQKNALIIVDIEGFVGFHEADYTGPMDDYLDALPKDKVWAESVLEMDGDNAFEHFFPILKSHQNLLSRKAIKETVETKEKYANGEVDENLGCLKMGKTADKFEEDYRANCKLFHSDSTTKSELPYYHQDNLIKFLEVCKENNVENVLFLECPKVYGKQSILDLQNTMFERTNTLKDIVSEYGYDTLVYSSLNNPAKLTVDNFVDHYHFRTQGAYNLSRWFAKYINSNYKFN